MAIRKDMKFGGLMDAFGSSGARENLTVAPNNGSEFVGNTGMLQFEIHGNQIGAFADLSSAYIAADFTNTSPDVAADANDVYLQNLGTLGVVSRLVVSTNTNKTICDITNKNNLDAIMIAKHVESSWLDSTANILYGTTSNFAADGTRIVLADKHANGTEYPKRFIIPLSLIGIDEMMFPLCAQEHLRFQVYLENSQIATFATGSAITTSGLKLTSVLLHYDVVKLTPSQFDDVLQKLGGVFTLDVPCWQHQDATIALGDLQVSNVLGFSKTRAKRLLVSLRNTDFTGPNANTKNSFAMDRANVTTISLKLNGKEVKTQAYTISNNGPEVFAESIKSNGGRIMDIVSVDSSRALMQTAEGAGGTTNALSGRYFFEFDLQNGLEIEDVSMSGLNIASGNFTLALTKSAATTANRQLDCYLEYWNTLELDMRGSKTWVVSN